MRAIVIGPDLHHRFEEWEPTDLLEHEFEQEVAASLPKAFPCYRCIPFRADVELDGAVHRPDLALIASNFSHWFVVEVELAGHSLQHHVLPQIRTFRYGTYGPSAEAALVRWLRIDAGRAGTLLNFVPRGVAVIVNEFDREWKDAIAGVGASYVVLSMYRNGKGDQIVATDGDLTVLQKSLGFGRYFAPERAIHIGAAVAKLLPDALVHFHQGGGSATAWRVQIEPSTSSAWLVRDHGTPAIRDGASVQLLQSVDGRFFLRLC